jgi:drug/metabolite transporter (DMT)-like permease
LPVPFWSRSARPGTAGSWLGDALVLAGAASAAGYNVGARKFTQGIGSIEVTAVQLLAAAVLSVPLLLGGAAAGHSHLGHVDAAHLLAAVATGVLGTAVPFMLFNAAIGQMQVSRVAVMLNLIPIFGVTLAVLLLSERLGLAQLAGAVLVLVAVVGAREPVRTSHPPQPSHLPLSPEGGVSTEIHRGPGSGREQSNTTGRRRSSPSLTGCAQ